MRLIAPVRLSAETHSGVLDTHGTGRARYRATPYSIASSRSPVVAGHASGGAGSSFPASRHNLIRAENGAIRFVPRIEKRPWTRSRVVLWSAKVLLRRGSKHMRRTDIRMGEKLAQIRQPDRNDDAARRFDPAKERAPRLWSEFCSRGFPSPIQGACGLRGNSGRIQRAYVSNGVRSPQ